MIPEPAAWISGRYHNMTVKELFNTIYTQYYAKSFRFANLYVRNDLAAEDITTDRFVCIMHLFLSKHFLYF